MIADHAEDWSDTAFLAFNYIWKRLREIEDILGDDYELGRLRELMEADRDGRVRIARRPPLESECCGNCGHFQRITGTARTNGAKSTTDLLIVAENVVRPSGAAHRRRTDMERLTIRSKFANEVYLTGKAGVCWADRPAEERAFCAGCHRHKGMDRTNCGVLMLIDRLAAYEDTGLEPEEIQAIAGLASENCAKTADEIDKLLQDDAELKSYRELGPIDRLRELAQADRDGLVRIARRPPLEDECCGNCGHFRRIAGTRRGDCSVHGYIKNRLGQEDRSRGRFTPFQSRKACRQFQRRTDDDGRSDPEG